MGSTREAREQDGLPKWIKTVAAVIGIVATSATIMTGIGAIIMQYRSTMVELEKERTQQQVALKEAEEYKLQQAKEKAEVRDLERQGRVAEQEQALVMKREEARLAESQIRQKQEIAETQEGERKAREEKDFLLKVSRIADSDKPSLGDLVTIKRAARLHPEYDDMVANALVARAEKSNSLSEVRLIFSILRSLRPREIRDEVAGLRREALEKYRQMLQGVFVVHLIHYQGGQVSREAVCDTMQLFPRRIKNSDLAPSAQRAIVVGGLALNDNGLKELDEEVKKAKDVLFDDDRVAEGEQAYLDQISINGLIISSAQSIFPGSTESSDTKEKIEDLDRFCPDASGSPSLQDG
jgi:competence protein ComGC